jgi:hypothetical protein
MISLIIGFIIGLILAYFLSRNMGNISLGPDSSKVKSKIYKDEEGKCYQLVPHVCVCPIFNI